MRMNTLQAGKGPADLEAFACKPRYYSKFGGPGRPPNGEHPTELLTVAIPAF